MERQLLVVVKQGHGTSPIIGLFIIYASTQLYALVSSLLNIMLLMAGCTTDHTECIPI